MGNIKSEAMARPHGEHAFGSWLPLILSIGATLLGVGYLGAVVWGSGVNRFGTTEAVILGASLLLNAYFLQRIERLEISGEGVNSQVRAVQEEQVHQRAEIRSLKPLVRYFVTEQEFGHLLKLSGKMSSVYFNPDDRHHENFGNELLRLHSIGLIQMQEGKFIGAMPKKGDLNEHCRITDRGQEYLKLREEVESHEQEGV